MIGVSGAPDPGPSCVGGGGGAWGSNSEEERRGRRDWSWREGLEIGPWGGALVWASSPACTTGGGPAGLSACHQALPGVASHPTASLFLADSRGIPGYPTDVRVFGTAIFPNDAVIPAGVAGC